MISEKDKQSFINEIWNSNTKDKKTTKKKEVDGKVIRDSKKDSGGSKELRGDKGDKGKPRMVRPKLRTKNEEDRVD